MSTFHFLLTMVPLLVAEFSPNGRNDLRTTDRRTGRWSLAGSALDVQRMLSDRSSAGLRLGADVRGWTESFVSHLVFLFLFYL